MVKPIFYTPLWKLKVRSINCINNISENNITAVTVRYVQKLTVIHPLRKQERTTLRPILYYNIQNLRPFLVSSQYQYLLVCCWPIIGDQCARPSHFPAGTERKEEGRGWLVFRGLRHNGLLVWDCLGSSASSITTHLAMAYVSALAWSLLF